VKTIKIAGAEALWTKDGEYPLFLEASGAKYHRSPWKDMEDRGITNRLLESLILALPKGTIIAGGFMTAVMGQNKDASDIDLFFTSSEAFVEAFNLLNSDEKPDDEHWAIEGYSLAPESAIAFTKSDLGVYTVNKDVRFIKFIHPKRPPIQLIKLAWYRDAEQVIDSFDLTVAQFAIDIHTAELICNPLSIMDLLGKKIVLHRMQFPSSTLRRIIKYTKKGYYACAGSLGKVAALTATHIQNENPHFFYID
jgi:hypothetical protein